MKCTVVFSIITAGISKGNDKHNNFSLKLNMKIQWLKPLLSKNILVLFLGCLVRVSKIK